MNFIIKYIYDCFHESRVNKKREEIILYDPHNTLFTWIIFSFPFFFPSMFFFCFFQISIPSCNIIFIWDWASYFFQFTFYEVMSVSWPGPRVWLGLLEFFFLFLICCLTRFTRVFLPFPDLFSQFYPSILIWFRIRLLDLFWFEFNDIILVSWLRSWVSCVNLDWLKLFFCIVFNRILNFNFII